MSRTIDQKVVEMRFDNTGFEANVNKTMSAIDKLKQKLNFKSAEKGFENINSAASKVNLSIIGNAVDGIQAKFSALSVVGITALSRITDAAITAGTNIARALTIQPVTTGFQEYETQINAIQTILSNTRTKGTTLDDVNAALDELNHYADMTIYNFTEMTRNIGTFTAAGVDLQTSVDAIKGIANLAAVSGSTSAQASTAMYQLSQALATGRVSLMDWNSVVNAGMGGEVFQTALKRTAENMGKDVDALIEKYGSFRESLTMGGWLTTDVLTETLGQLAGAYTEADLLAKGYSQEQADEILALAQDAEDAATKVKTFTQLWDTMKEAAQSGWTNTWELIIGDFEEARSFLTDVSDEFNNMITASADARNAVLGEALTSNWEKLVGKLEDSGITEGALEESLTTVLNENGISVEELLDKYDSLEDAFQNGAISSDFLRQSIERLNDGFGDLSDIQTGLGYGAGFEEWGLIDNAEDVSEVQKALKQLGYDLGEFGETADGVDGRLGEMTEAALRAFQEANGLEITGIIDDATLQALQDATSGYNLLNDEVLNLVDNIDKLGGRQLLIESFWNIVDAVKSVADVIGKAWDAIFPSSAESKAQGIYDAISKFEEFTSNLTLSGDNADRVQRIFQGLFSILDLIGQAASAVWDGIKPLFGIAGDAGGGILDFLANIGDMITNFASAAEEGNLFGNIVQNISNFVQNAVQYVKDFANALGFDFHFPSLDEIINSIKSFLDLIKGTDQFASVSDFFTNIGESISNFFSSLLTAARNGGIEGVIETIKNFFSDLFDGVRLPDFSSGLSGFIDSIKNFFSDIANSIQFPDIGKGISDFIQSIKDQGGNVGDAIGGFDEIIQNGFEKIKDFFANFNWGSLIPIGIAAVLLTTFYKLGKGLSGIADLFGGLEGIGDIFEGVGKAFKNFSFEMKTKAIQNVATTILMLVGAIAIITMLDPAEVWSAVGVIAALMALLTGMTILLDKFGSSSKKTKAFDGVGMAASIAAIGIAMLAMAATAKIMSTMDAESFTKGIIAVGAFALIVAGLMAASKLSGGNKVGSSILAISVAIGILAGIGYLLSGMDAESFSKGLIAVTLYAGIVAALMAVSKLTGGNKVGSSILAISVAIGILAGVGYLLSGMDAESFSKGLIAITKLSAIVAALMIVAKFSGASKVGGTLLAISAAIGIMAGIAVLLSLVDTSALETGIIAVGLLSVIMMTLATVVGAVGGKKAEGLGVTLLAISAAIGILAAIAIVLGQIDIQSLAQGIIAVGLIAGIMAALILVTKSAQKIQGTLIVLTVAVGILAAAVVVLSTIEPSRLAGATAAMTILIGMFAILMKASSNVKSSMAALIVMTVCVGLIAGVLALLSQLPVSQTLPTAIALSTLLLALSAVTVILGTFGKGGAGSIGAAATGAASLMTVVVIIGAVIAAVGALTEQFPQIESFLDTGISLLTDLATGLGEIISSFVTSLLTGITGSLPEIGTDLSDFMTNLDGFITGAQNISPEVLTGVGYLSGAILAIAGADAVSSFLDFFSHSSDYADMGTELSAFATSVQPFLSAMSQVSPDVATTTGYLADAILKLSTSDFINALSSIFGGGDFESFGEDIAKLGNGLQNFSIATEGIQDNEGISVAAKVASALADVANAIPREGGLLQDIIGGKDLGTFAQGVGQLGQGLKSFASAISGVSFDNTEGAVNAATALAAVAGAIPSTGGILQDIIGGKDLTSFAIGVGFLGVGLKSFADSVKDVDFTNTESAINAAKALGEAAKSIPSTGGILQDIIGGKDLASFATGVGFLGAGLVLFANATQDVSFDNVDAAVNAAKALGGVADSIPNTGGILQDIIGGKDLGTFAQGVGQLGQGLKSFASATDGIVDTDAEAAAGVAGTLANVSSTLSDSNFWDWISGDNDISNFSSQLQSLGEGLKNFSDSLEGINTENMDAASKVASTLADMSQNINNGAFNGLISNFAGQLGNLGNGIKTYSDNLEGVDNTKISIVSSSIDTIVDAIEKMNAIDTSGVSTFVNALNELSGADVQGFITAFEGVDTEFANSFNDIISGGLSNISTQETSFSSAGTTLANAITTGFDSGSGSFATEVNTVIESVLNGINSKEGEFKSAGLVLVNAVSDGFVAGSSGLASSLTGTITSCVIAIRGYYSMFYDAGSYVVSGFAAGISQNTYMATAKASAMASAAASAAASALKINSPSRVFMELGGYVPAGMAIGIDNMSYLVGNSIDSMTSSAVNLAETAMNRMNSTVGSQLNLSPTIRPVLDLSEIQNGARTIDGMFSSNMASRLDFAMNESLSYDPNGNIVSELGKLRRDIGEMDRSVYNVNGITYDDGSNIADAIRTLVRATIVEGRV